MRRPIFKAPAEGLGGIDGGTTFIDREGTRDMTSFPFGWDDANSDASSGTQEV